MFISKTKNRKRQIRSKTRKIRSRTRSRSQKLRVRTRGGGRSSDNSRSPRRTRRRNVPSSYQPGMMDTLQNVGATVKDTALNLMTTIGNYFYSKQSDKQPKRRRGSSRSPRRINYP